MSISFSILEYLGKISGGVLVLLSVIHQDEYYEATFFYTDKTNLLVISKELEDKIEMKIVDHPDYKEMINYMITKVVPFSQIYNRLDEVDITRWTINKNN